MCGCTLNFSSNGSLSFFCLASQLLLTTMLCYTFGNRKAGSDAHTMEGNWPNHHYITFKADQSDIFFFLHWQLSQSVTARPPIGADTRFKSPPCGELQCTVLFHQNFCKSKTEKMESKASMLFCSYLNEKMCDF